MAQKRGVITTPAFVYKEDTNTAKRSQRMPYYSLKGRLARLLSVVSLFVVIIIPVICLADAEKIFKENNKAVVFIVVYDEAGKAISQGSGFIVRRDGVIVTNYHVISNAASIKIKAGSKVLNVDGVIYLDKEKDIAILKADANNLPIVKLGNLDKANIGEKVYVIGSPKGLENTISDGILSGKREIAPNKLIIQITAPVSPGSSGGPLFNKNGEVIGIVTFLLTEAQNLNFAMPLDVIKNKITSNKVTAIKKGTIDDYRKTVEYWFYLGVAYGDSDKYREAAEANEQAILINPNVAEVHYNLGINYLHLGRFDEAVESFNQVLRIWPESADAYDGLGSAYMNLKSYQKAVESFKQAIHINPDDGFACLRLGLTYGHLRRPQEAVEAFKQAIRINPDNAEAYVDSGFNYFVLKRTQEAVEAFKQAIRINFDDAGAHYGLGLTYLYQLKNKGAAIDEYKILTKLDNDMAGKLFNDIYK